MDPRLLKYYNRELQHVREMGAEFAAEFPKIAARLGLEGFECADPYVERLLEGFAFLAARIQLKMDAEFPEFTQHLLSMVYPDFLAPTPSMAVVQLQPDPGEATLADGYVVARGSALRSPLGKGDVTPCEFRTAHDVTLWPIETAEAEYFSGTRDVAGLDKSLAQESRAGIRIKLRTTAGLAFDAIALDSLTLYLRGGGDVPMRLYEQFMANAVGIVVRPAKRPAPWQHVIERSNIGTVGFDQEHSLLPYGPRSFQGHRLLHEYFAFPERYMFVEIGGLGPAVRRCKDQEIEIVVLLRKTEPALANAIDAANFALFCTPAINLFPRRADNIHLTERDHEYHVVPDRTTPMDFELWDVTEVVGSGTSAEGGIEFLPFYTRRNPATHKSRGAYYTLRRVPRLLSSSQQRQGPRSSYIGGETFISLVDAEEAPFRSDMRQLALSTLCTNRDLPLHLSVGVGRTDFTVQSGAPVVAVRALSGPTKPRASRAEGELAWRLVSHLSLNYLSLTESEDGQGAAALRELLMLYGGDAEASLQKQVEGVQSVASLPVNRRLLVSGRAVYARGLEVTLGFDEAAFEGSGVFLLGSVLEKFFAKYVSINSFTETVVRTRERGELIRWPVRTGIRHAL